jgi:hypothetical protein
VNNTNNTVDNPLFVYLHIPKPGGTTLIWSIGNHFHREDDRYLRHYHWMNTPEYLFNNIPILQCRTVDQQKQLKFLTGHGTYDMAHYWLKVRRNPLLFTTIRDPIDRLLSSFNYRHGVSTLVQDPAEFSYTDPPMDPHARFNKKTSIDYPTLWEWYCDSQAEHNIQTKWIIKSFYNFLDDRFIAWEDIVRKNNPEVNPDIWPDWFETIPVDDQMYNTALNCIKHKIWWAGTSDTLSTDIVDLCKYADTPYVKVDDRHRSGIDFPRVWTREDVESQPDYHKLVSAEQYDIGLYNYVKKLKRPF